MPSAPPAPVRAYALVVAAATFFLIIAGGLVTSTGSGLAVPDWPLSFGQFFPKMEGGVFYEHGHRMIAAFVGLLTVILAIAMGVSRADAGLKKACYIAVGLVILQGVLGGVTVLLQLPTLVSVLHACLGQSFFTTIVCIAVLANTRAGVASPADPAQARKILRLAMMVAGFIFLQLVLGAIYRHSGKMLHAHMLGAFIVVVHVILLARRTVGANVPGWMRNLAYGLSALVALQVLLGLHAWRMPLVAVTTAHVASGALLLAGSTVFWVQGKRYWTGL
jgi:cytochrome c oxidase assembly protein subunit 15